MTYDSKNITEFIQSSIEGIEEGIQSNKSKFRFETPIEFELSVSVKKRAEGKIDIVVASAGGKYDKEEISKIKFSIGTEDMSKRNLEFQRKIGRSIFEPMIELEERRKES